MMTRILQKRRGSMACLAAAFTTFVVMAQADARAQGPNAQAPASQGTSTVQGVPNAVQGFSQNRDKPIQIDAASLEVRDKEKAATFKGDVKVVQGDTTMRCKTLIVYYEGNSMSGGNNATASASAPAPAPAAAPKQTATAATPGPGGSSSIRRLEARGGVIVTQQEQTVTGENGDFDMKTNIVTMSGNVILTKGDNVLKGDKLIVDMTTGVSRVEMKNNGGRVSGLFKSSGQNGPQGTPSLLPGSSPQPSPHPPANSPGKPMSLNDMTGSGAR